MDLNLLLRAGGVIFTVSMVKNFIIVPQKLTNLHAKRKCSSNVKQERLSELIKNAFNDAWKNCLALNFDSFKKSQAFLTKSKDAI